MFIKEGYYLYLIIGNWIYWIFAANMCQRCAKRSIYDALSLANTPIVIIETKFCINFIRTLYTWYITTESKKLHVPYQILCMPSLCNIKNPKIFLKEAVFLFNAQIGCLIALTLDVLGWQHQQYEYTFSLLA